MKEASNIPKIKKPLHIRYRIEKVIFYTLWVVSSILILRILFLLLGANKDAPFISWLYDLSAIFITPFAGIFKSPEYGTAVVDSTSIVAIFIYFVIAVAIVKLINVTNIKR